MNRSDRSAAPARMDAVVLAGSRPQDPLTRHCGVPCKALIAIDGEPMLLRVLRALAASGLVQRAFVVGDDALDSLIATHPGGLRCTRLNPAGSPAASVAAALETATRPVLVTTADHALLTPQIVTAFADAALANGGDLAVGLAALEQVQSRFPSSRRTPLRFADGRLSGCNLFLFHSARAGSVPAWWRRVEQQRKRPWRLIRQLGPGYVIRYLCGRLTLSAALGRLGTLTGCEIRAVIIEHPEAAFDIDSLEDLDLCRRYLGTQGNNPP